MNSVRYNPTWAAIYISFGFIFMIIFIMGYLLLDDLTNLLMAPLSFLIIHRGFHMKNKAYIEYSDKQIVVRSVYGGIRHNYQFEKKSEVEVRKNHLYHNGKKLKCNDMLIRKEDWLRLLAFFSDQDEVLMTELQD